MEYHFMGSGIKGTSLSIPLATGNHGHKIAELILKHVIEIGNNLPKAEFVREAIERVNEVYRKEVNEFGFGDLQENERAEYVAAEQITLLSGLIWSWASVILPTFLEQFEVLHVEQEMERIVGCTCGLSNTGTVKDHVARGCGGVVVMTRPDCVARNYNTRGISYIEFKTGSKIESGTYEGDVQFAFGAAGIEGFTGEELTNSFVHGLVKGYRRAKDENSLPYQSSPLCYAYVFPGSPPLVPQDIIFKYTKRKGYIKTPVWEIDFEDCPPELPPMEHYISLMAARDEETFNSLVRVFGPYPYPRRQIEETLADIEHLERRNHEVYAYINQRVGELGFSHEEVQKEIHEFIPKSWACRRYGWRVCNFHPICMKQAGWDDPCKYMGYVPRTPNHPTEFEEFDV